MTIFCLLTLLEDNFSPTASSGRISWEVSGPGFPYLRGLVERCALLPRSNTPWQGEEDTPILDDQLRHKGHFNEDGGTGRQIAHTDGEHVLQRERNTKQHHDQSGPHLSSDLLEVNAAEKYFLE